MQQINSPISAMIMNVQKIHHYITLNQQKTILTNNIAFGVIICIEICFAVNGMVEKDTFHWYIILKTIINLLSILSLTILLRSLNGTNSRIKTYVAYVTSWITMINEAWFEGYEAQSYEESQNCYPIFLSILAFKVFTLQMLIISLPVNNILKMLPMTCIGILILVFVSIYALSIRFLLETAVCLLALICMGMLILKKEEFLSHIVSSNVEELLFHRRISQAVPLGILLTDRSYQAIYQNHQMQNYFDTLPSNLRNPLNLFRQFRGAEVSEECLMTLIKEVLNQRVEGQSSHHIDQVCLEDALDIMFKHYKVVENALRGSNMRGNDILPNCIKFYMKNIDTIIEVRLFPVRLGTKECALLLFSDYTEHVAPLIGGDENTQYLFLASLSHELKTPLNSALSLMQASIEETTIPEELKQKLLMPALASMQILSYNIKDLIDYSKINHGSLGLRLETCNIASLVEKTIKLVDQQAQKKKISIFSKIDPDIPSEWCTDPDRVCQAILNLLSNALKYTLKGFIVVSVKYLETRGLIKIKITDTGIGMEKEDLSRLQKALKNQDMLPKKLNLHSIGIGLGLTVSNQICSILGPHKYDYLRVKSNPNRGSEFTFYIDNKTKIHLTSLEGAVTIETHESLLSDVSNLRPKQFFNRNNKHRYSTRKESIFSPNRHQKNERAYQSKETVILDDKFEESLDASNDSSPSLYANTSLLSQRYSSFESTNKKRNHNILKHQVSAKGIKKSHQENEKIDPPQRVLIVDDDSFNILSLEVLFKNLNIAHDHAYNGKQAIEKVLTNKYDLIMMDCNMPVMDGWEATRQILKLIADGKVDKTIIVACTAFEDAENLAKCCEAGMKYIIQKPVNADKLSNLLKKLSL